MVPDATSVISEELRIFGMSLWRIFLSHFLSKTSALSRFGPAPVSKIKMIGRIPDEINPAERDTLHILLLESEISSICGNARISCYGSSGFLVFFLS